MLVFVLATITILINAQNYCNYSEDCLFWQIQPEDVLNENNVIYAANVKKYDGFGLVNINLFLDIYYPDIDADEVRPLVIVVHGGGFVTGTRYENTFFAQTLANYGYVVANIDYRTCETLNCQGMETFGPCLNNNTGQIMRARYIATLDALTAAEYLITNASRYPLSYF